MAITEGKLAPAFTLEDQDGNRVALKDFRGSPVVVYFYPKDDTAGLNEGGSLWIPRRVRTRSEDQGAEVARECLPDGPESHRQLHREVRPAVRSALRIRSAR